MKSPLCLEAYTTAQLEQMIFERLLLLKTKSGDVLNAAEAAHDLAKWLME